MKKKLSIFAVVAVIVLVITFVATNRTEAINEDDRIAEYEKAFYQVKEEYNIKLVFDKDALIENVIGKMTIEEFKQSLIDSQKVVKTRSLNASDYKYDVVTGDDEEGKKKLINFDMIPRPRTSGGIVTFYNYYSQNGRHGLLWADFWHVDLGTIQYFDSFVKAGTGSNDITWYFRGVQSSLTSFSQSSAKVKYTGQWTWGPTGMSEPMLITTTSTYKPN